MNSVLIQPKLGLKGNWKQFSLLVLINGFVGAMVGLERSIFPQFADEVFGITSESAILSFIIIFGVCKAFSNYFAGRLADRIGRKNLLAIGWTLALPVPLILAFSNSWTFILFSNAILGISQGLTWSSTVVMKIDLVGEKERGLAMGLNEFAGYLSIGISAYLTAIIADQFGIRPFPFLIGIAISSVGLFLSIFFVNDTGSHVQSELYTKSLPKQKSLFWKTTFTDKNLSSITQAGLVNNLNDGMIWGLFPIFLTKIGYGLTDIGSLVAIYPMAWGFGQLATGRLADIYSKKRILVIGMIAQGLAILLIPSSSSTIQIVSLSLVLGLATAMVYPTFLAGIADYTHPVQRAEAIGIFRLWRDLGYAFGAVFSGLITVQIGVEFSIAAIGILTLFSGLLVWLRMPGKTN